MHTIHFLDNHQPEVGAEATTCRKGLKWYNLVNVDNEVNLAHDPEGTIVGRAVVTKLWFGPFRQVPAIFVDIEQNPACQSYPGLLAAMQKTYENFKDTDLVTVVQYKRTE